MRAKADAIAWLQKFGYLEEGKPRGSEFSDALKHMQKRYGLKADGIHGPFTDRSMSLFRCAVADVLQIRVAGTTDCKWSKKELTYYHSPNFRLARLGTRTSAKLVATAVKLWTQHIPIKIKKGRHRSRADITVDTGRGSQNGFDGIGNVLGWAYMPCGDLDEQLEMMLDEQEPWSEDLAKRAGVLALAVLCHEFGHILGLDHSTSESDLMAAFYNPQIWAPQKGDVKRVQRLYGEPDTPTKPITIDVKGLLTAGEDGVKLDLKYV